MSPIERGRLCATVLSGEPREKLLALHQRTQDKIEILLGQTTGTTTDTLSFMLGFEDALFDVLRSNGNNGPSKTEIQPSVQVERAGRERVEVRYYHTTIGNTGITTPSPSGREVF